MNYNKKLGYSYTLGAYPTLEICLKRPELVRVIYVDPQISQELEEKISLLADKNHLELIKSPNFFKGLEKDNIYLAAKFNKYKEKIRPGNHLILHRPEQIGNLGTIFRSALAFGKEDLAIIEPSCDSFNPASIRASMGAIFSLRVQHFSSMEDYEKNFGNKVYAFMTGQHPLLKELELEKPYSLLFGSESSGLPEDFALKYQPVKIKMSPKVDSLNLGLAVGIALHHTY